MPIRIFDIAVRQSFRNFDLVEIARGVVIDGRPEQVAQIAHTSSGSDLRRMRAQICQLLLDRGGEVGFKSVLPHDFFRDGLQVEVRSGVGHEVSSGVEIQ